MRRIAANYIFPITSDPIRNGYVDFADDGTVTGIGQMSGELSHLEGKFREATGMSGFIDQINALRESAPAEERQKAMRRQFMKLYAEGVSAMADISNCDESFAMKSEGPMYTRTFVEVFGSEPEDAPAVIADARKLVEKAAAAGLDAAITPHSPYTMSPDLLRMASAEGLNAGFISYHNQESQEEDDMIGFHRGPLYENYVNRHLSVAPATGKPAVFHFLDQLQKVHPAPFDEHILLIHNTVAREDSIRAAESVLRDCTWVTCPLSNIFIHRAMADLPLLMSMGVRIAVGSAPSSRASVPEPYSSTPWTSRPCSSRPKAPREGCSEIFNRLNSTHYVHDTFSQDSLRPHKEPPPGQLPGHQPPA